MLRAKEFGHRIERLQASHDEADIDSCVVELETDLEHDPALASLFASFLPGMELSKRAIVLCLVRDLPGAAAAIATVEAWAAVSEAAGWDGLGEMQQWVQDEAALHSLIQALSAVREWTPEQVDQLEGVLASGTGLRVMAALDLLRGWLSHRSRARPAWVLHRLQSLREGPDPKVAAYAGKVAMSLAPR